MINKIIIIVLCLLGFIATVNAQTTSAETPETEKQTGQKANQRPAEEPKKAEPFDQTDVKTMATKCVVFETEKGNIKMEMFPESAPETVRNFLNLVATGALNTTTFSRVVPDFIIQGGDLYTSENLTNDLKWRAVRNIPDEPNQIKHERGIISMARGDEPNSASTSFFILLSSSVYLDGKFAAFGRVVEGIEVVETINKMEVEAETPKNPVRIKTASVKPCVVEEKTDSKVEIKEPN